MSLSDCFVVLLVQSSSKRPHGTKVNGKTLVSSSVAEIKRFSAFAIRLNELESRLVMRDALASDA
jgi:hypothetical protein